ncbi:MAG: glycerophosphodiester phosphodiesterase [Niabella sp. SCN 42-15]|nr:MAG: glycerophosphodiester phosphodiesterase [Niabella sp. SCN 42-15]
MKQFCIAFICMVFLFSCATTKNTTVSLPAFDKEGHRGARGLMPENTIPAMLKGIDLGVTTLEMDLQITKDKKVVVSHDPNFNANITTTPQGKFLSKEEAKNLMLYSLNYDEIKKYDVGLKPHPDFPRQQKIAVHKPLLADLLDATEKYAKEKGINILYNIEIKSNKKNDGINHPPVEEFVDLAMAVIHQKRIAGRTIIQSFDPRALVLMRKKYPSVKTSLLIEAFDKRSLDEQLKEIGFTPTVYSPNHMLVTKQLVNACHQKGIKVVPWTINDLPRMKELIALGVDGIITDYPDLFGQL